MLAENYIQNWDEVVKHVLECYPNEAGGIVTTDNIFHPIANVSETPLTGFEFHPREMIEKDVKCILHSHPYDPNAAPEDDPRIPSKCDLEGQINTDIEWAIVVTEGENVTPPIFWGDYDHRPDLFNREFIHSVQDCLAFMCDWQYKEYGLKLPMFPRHFDWFQEGEDHMEQQYEGWGFKDVSHLPQEKGDVVFYRIQSQVVNHVAVVAEPNVVVHQLYGRFPKTEPYEVWAKYIVKRIRHSSHPSFKTA